MGYRQIFTSNEARTSSLAPWLEYGNTTRAHGAFGNRHQPRETNVIAGYI